MIESNTSIISDGSSQNNIDEERFPIELIHSVVGA